MGVYQGKAGRVCHVEGAAQAKAKGQISSSVECWSCLALADCESRPCSSLPSSALNDIT